MLKNTIVLKRGKWEIYYLYISALGIIFGISPFLELSSFVLISLVYTYKNSLVSYVLFSIVLSLCSSLYDIHYTFLYLFFIIGVYIVLKSYEMLKINRTIIITIANTILCMIGVYYIEASYQIIIVFGVQSFILHTYFISNQKSKYLENTFFLLSVLTLTYLNSIFYFPENGLYASIVFAVITAYFIPFDLYIFIALYFSFMGVHYYYLFYLMYISYQTENRIRLSFLTLLAFIFRFHLYNMIFSFLCICMSFITYKEETDFMNRTYDIEKNHSLYMKQSFYKQIVNYSTIFYNLSHYYEDKNREESQMLYLMGEAISYNAKVSKQYLHRKIEMKDRILEVLNGYHFKITHCVYEEEEDKIRIHLIICDLYENEIKEVIFPLLEKMTQTQLKLSVKKSLPFQKEKYEMVFESKEYLEVDVYYDSVNLKELSGDSAHSFLMDQNVICMLSDGMGAGMKAKKTSMILVQLMENMIRCEFPQVECVKMINQFLRSDIYATLDVLVFDRKKQIAYLSKSASAPTYLLRSGILYEMNAHSLPIGIVENVQADIYEIHFKKEDIFMMVSDGIEKEEVERWAGLKRCVTARNDGLNMMSIVRDKKRKDDSTMMIAKVK